MSVRHGIRKEAMAVRLLVLTLLIGVVVAAAFLVGTERPAEQAPAGEAFQAPVAPLDPAASVYSEPTATPAEPDWEQLTVDLGSVDEGVRVEAAWTLYMLAVKGADFDVSHPPLRAALEDALDDAGESVREPVASMLWMAYSASPATETLLADHYAVETSAKVKIAIVTGLHELAYHGYTSQTGEDAVLDALQSSVDRLRGAAAQYVGAHTPSEALPILAANMDSEDVFIQQEFVTAVGSYGSAASAHLPQLYEMLDNVDDAHLRSVIQRAINEIEGN